MPKIVFLGAGSTVFAVNLLSDILSFPELSDSTIALYDIDPERLETTRVVGNRIAKTLGAYPTIKTYSDRREVLDGADYAIGMFQVGGYDPATLVDFNIPKKFGLQQTIGDTVGVGGIMRALRTIPVYLDMCRDMEELCPDVFLLNYVNPMAMVTWAINQGTKIKTLGLCHSVQGTARHLAGLIGIPVNEIEYICAGINHMAFYLRFEREGEDLYPLVQKVIEDGRVPQDDQVRFEMFKRLGYFVTESSEHFAEYTPWFIKRDRPDLINSFNVPLDEYLRRCRVQIAGWELMHKKLKDPATKVDQKQFADLLIKAGATDHELEMVDQILNSMDEPQLSHEYGAYIIHSIETGHPRVVYGNVMNEGLIDNLPKACCVEVPCLVDKKGVHPNKIGRLPIQLAALMQTNINVQALTVEAALTLKREHIYHAAMLDPHTAAELDLEQIWALVDELIQAHSDWLPEYLG